MRETWCSAYARGCWGTVFAADGAFAQGKRQHEKGPHFNAEWSGPTPQTYRFRPSIHMPRWASRITLEVTGVRVERLQDITEEDARAEGVEPLAGMSGWNVFTDDGQSYWDSHKPKRGVDGVRDYVASGPIGALDSRTQFVALWDRINGKRFPWASNPHVWVVSFNRVEGRRDE